MTRKVRTRRGRRQVLSSRARKAAIRWGRRRQGKITGSRNRRRGIAPRLRKYNRGSRASRTARAKLLRHPAPPFPASAISRTTAILGVQEPYPAVHSILDELQKLPLEDIILVLRHSDDAWFAQLRAHPARPILVRAQPPSESDTEAREAGARISRSDILLFADAEKAVPAEALVPLILAVAGGVEMAVQNGSAGPPSLPYSLSRTAAERMGCGRAADPSAALSDALRLGMSVQAPIAAGAAEAPSGEQEKLQVSSHSLQPRSASEPPSPLLSRDSDDLPHVAGGERP